MHQPEPKCHIDLSSQLFHSWGGVHQPEVKCHIDLRFQVFHSWVGGIHQPEAKCHIDLRFQLFHSWGGGVHQPEAKCHTDLIFQFFHSWGGVHQKSLKLVSTFPILGGGVVVHLQVDQKSVRFTDSGWLSTAAVSGQLC